MYPSSARVVYRCNRGQIPPHSCTSLNNVQLTCSIHGFTRLSSYVYKSSYPVRLKTRLFKLDNEFPLSPVCWIAYSDLTMFLISLNQIKDIRKDIEKFLLKAKIFIFCSHDYLKKYFLQYISLVNFLNEHLNDFYFEKKMQYCIKNIRLILKLSILPHVN